MTQESVLILTLAGAIGTGTPLVFAAIGGVISERAGVINLGMEGMMLIGAVTTFLVVNKTGSPLLGFIAGGIAGALLALIHATLAISLRANQIVCGLALTIFGTGLASFIGKPIEGAGLEKSFNKLKIPFLSDIPAVGPVLFKQDGLVYFSWFVALLASLYLNRTRTGLSLRAVGENPATADAMGLSVVRMSTRRLWWFLCHSSNRSGLESGWYYKRNWLDCVGACGLCIMAPFESNRRCLSLWRRPTSKLCPPSKGHHCDTRRIFGNASLSPYSGDLGGAYRKPQNTWRRSSSSTWSSIRTR